MAQHGHAATAAMAPSEQLRSAGLRVTSPRVAVLSELAEHPHTDADHLTKVVRERLGKVSTQAIYDVLRALTEADLVRRIEPAGSSALLELRRGDNHHHVVCRTCGTVEDVECAVGEVPCLTAKQTHGFIIDEAEVVYWGQCPQCRDSAAPSPDGRSETNGSP